MAYLFNTLYVVKSIVVRILADSAVCVAKRKSCV